MNFIKEIKYNLSNVDQTEIERLYSSIYPEGGSVGIYLGGEIGGRSLQGLIIGARPLAYLENIRIYAAGDSLVPGENISRVMDYLSKVCNKSAYICVSGSGNSVGSYNDTKKLIGGNINKKAHLSLITSSPDSKIGNLLAENEGNITKLKGRKSKSGTGQEYIKSGLLEDEFELGATQLAKIISNAIVYDIETEKFYDFYKEQSNVLDNTQTIIKNLKKSHAYKSLLEALANPARNVISCGQGMCDLIAIMNNTRLGHVRPLTLQKFGAMDYSDLPIEANRNYVLGESSVPNMDENTVLICISQSGTGIVQDKIREAEKNNFEYYVITGQGDFPEENTLRIESNNFYPDSCFLLSSILMDLGIHLVEAGVEINEEVLRKIHINDKLSSKH